MTVRCGSCGTPVGDGYLCRGCTRALVSDLSDVAWLSDELDTQLSRQATAGAVGAGRRHSDPPLPYDVAASEAASRLRSTLSTWAPADSDMATAPQMAARLLGRIERIRRGRWAWLMRDQIAGAVDNARRAIDRPGVVRFLPCPSEDDCRGRIRVTADTIVARCDVCGWETDNLPWLGRMLRADEPALVTATDACHRLRVEGVELAPATIRKWVERGKLAALACTIIGRRNLYDLDEIRAVALPKL